MSKTIPQILLEIHEHKTCSPTQLYRYIKAFDIKPVGMIRQHPQRYPADTAQKILAGLGLVTDQAPELVSMDALRAEKRKARKARGA